MEPSTYNKIEYLGKMKLSNHIGSVSSVNFLFVYMAVTIKHVWLKSFNDLVSISEKKYLICFLVIICFKQCLDLPNNRYFSKV